MKQSTMKPLMGLAPCLLLLLLLNTNNIEARRINDVVDSKPSRHRRDTIIKSNDMAGAQTDYMLNLETFNLYNCEGMFLDASGPGTLDTNFYSETVVQYDYDMFVEKDSDPNVALVTLQDGLLRHVGEEVFTDCSSSRRLVGGIKVTANRQLDEEVSVQEITSAPPDKVSSTSSCTIEDATFATETDCYPVTGYITAYYSPSSGDENVNNDDESAVHQTVADSVKDAMDESVLVSDTTKGVYYLGDRDTFTFDSSESYLKEGAPAPESSKDDTSSSTPIAGIIGGVGAGLVAVALVAVLIKKKRSKKNSDEDVAAPVESVDTELANNVDEEDPQQAAETEQEVAETEERTPSKDFEYTEANCTRPSVGCNFLEVFGDDKDDAAN